MFVCGFWVVMIALNQYFDGRNKARMMLMLFMAVATLLYAGHCVFLNRFYSNMPLFDSLYAFSNLAVYPMFLPLHRQYDLVGESLASHMVVSRPGGGDRYNSFDHIHDNVASRH